MLREGDDTKPALGLPSFPPAYETLLRPVADTTLVAGVRYDGGQKSLDFLKAAKIRPFTVEFNGRVYFRIAAPDALRARTILATDPELNKQQPIIKNGTLIEDAVVN